jgi:hypothetical protein
MTVMNDSRPYRHTHRDAELATALVSAAFGEADIAKNVWLFETVRNILAVSCFAPCDFVPRQPSGNFVFPIRPASIVWFCHRMVAKMQTDRASLSEKVSG